MRNEDQLTKLKKEVLNLEYELESLQLEEKQAKFDLNESFRGRGVTVEGARPHYNALDYEYDQKKTTVGIKLNKAKQKYRMLCLEQDERSLPIKLLISQARGIYTERTIPGDEYIPGNKASKFIMLFKDNDNLVVKKVKELTRLSKVSDSKSNINDGIMKMLEASSYEKCSEFILFGGEGYYVNRIEYAPEWTDPV